MTYVGNVRELVLPGTSCLVMAFAILLCGNGTWVIKNKNISKIKEL
jgi:hypothetical protein